MIISGIALGLHLKFGISDDDVVMDTFSDQIHNNVNSSDFGNSTVVHITSMTIASIILSVASLLISIVTLIAIYRLFVTNVKT